MDPITIIGILLALGATFAALFMGGMDPVAIFFGSPASILLVLVGTIGVTLASGTMTQATGAAKVLIKAITGGGSVDQAATITQLVEFAEVARKEGLLALESKVEGIEDPFLKMGLELAVDGTDPEEIADVMALDLRRLMMRHKDGAAFFTNAAGFAPAMGMVGTVLGLIDMLGKLDDPSTLGPSMAVAFITTPLGRLPGQLPVHAAVESAEEAVGRRGDLPRAGDRRGPRRAVGGEPPGTGRQTGSLPPAQQTGRGPGATGCLRRHPRP